MNDGRAKFCGGCGVPIVASVTRHAPSPDAYTPKHLAERILTSKTALEGERKQVTILFADLKSSMELLADRDPEEGREILDPVLELMMEAVHRYEGTVNQVMGDGIMALFGAPLAHEDHAVRACYAALRMQDAVKQYGDRLWRVEGIPVRIRIGLNSGEVVVRAIGSDLQMDYTAVGQTTHLAARMEQMADSGSTLLTVGTLALAEGFVDVRSLGPTAVKGLSEPVDVFELVGGRAVHSRLQATLPRGLTRFVGRSGEVAELHEALDVARSGAGQVIAVVGEPGVGKSRLLWEFTHSHRSSGCLVLEAASASYGRATAFYPVIELLRGYFGIEPRDDARIIREKLTGKLVPLDRALAEASLPAMLSLLDVPVEDERWERLDPLQRRQRTLEAVAGVLLREGRRQPLVVVFEDLHWIDDGTQALLDTLVEGVSTAPLLLLVSYRSEYSHAWSGKSYYRQISLDPLRSDSAEQLLHGLLGDDSSLRALRAMLVERTEGNPLFLEEMVRSLIETRVLVGERGAYRMSGGPDTIKLSPTVQSIISARIDRLAPQDKRLLQAASVIGVDVPSQVLERIAESAGDELRRSIGRLETAGFLGELRLYPDIEYTFRHALTCEVAYASLLRDRRQSLHASILAVMEHLFPGQLAEHMERLAHHAVRGEAWPKAVTYCRGAGMKALALSVNHAAATHFQHALEAVTHLEQTSQTITTAIDLRLELRSALSPLGEHKKMFEALREAEGLADELADSRRLGRIVAFRSNLFALRGEFDRALAEGRRALEIADGLDDVPLRILANGFLGITHWARGEYRNAVDVAGRNVRELIEGRRLERFGLSVLPAVYSRTAMVLSLAELGEFAECFALGGEAIAIAEASGHPQSVISACLGLGTAYIRRGDLEQGISTLERGRTLAEATALSGIVIELAPALVSAYAQAGRITDAEALVEDAVARAIALRNSLGHWVRSGGGAEASLCAGRADEALPMAELYVQGTRLVGARGNEAWALRLLGDVLANHSECTHDAAASALSTALDLARELGMRPLEGRCHFTSACLALRWGSHETAHTLLNQAAEIFRCLEMPAWLAKAEAMMQSVR